MQVTKTFFSYAKAPGDPKYRSIRSNYRRIRYIRYADDFLVGFVGPKDEAEEIKDQLKTFLNEQLRLELSSEKTLITHALTEKAQFLGYDISAGGPSVSLPSFLRKYFPHNNLDAIFV